MTTHVLIVDEHTFPIHLQYMFAGTGSGEKKVGDIIDCTDNNIHWSCEAGLVSMLADGARIRQGDYIIFYLQQTNRHEGLFFGIFQAAQDSVFIDDNSSAQYLKKELKKSLTFRLLIKPCEVYSKGVTEWEALDVIRGIHSPNQMLWSLIYRKLKGNRGNTMITEYEAERLFELIRLKNDRTPLTNEHFRYENKLIIPADSTSPYLGQTKTADILQRLKHKYSVHRAHEAHLQAYIVQNIGKGTNPSLDKALCITTTDWIGNEVSCGVGMQRIDILISHHMSDIQREVMPIELKCIPAETYNARQLIRYIDWLEQYYVPNHPSRIQPILICRKNKNSISQEVANSFSAFDEKMKGRCLPLRFIEYHFDHDKLVFERIR